MFEEDNDETKVSGPLYMHHLTGARLWTELREVLFGAGCTVLYLQNSQNVLL